MKDYCYDFDDMAEASPCRRPSFPVSAWVKGVDRLPR